MINFHPLGDRILIKEVEKEQSTTRSGLLIIPDSAKEKPQEGEVVAIGQGRMGEDGRLMPMNVKIGDKVLYGKYSGQSIKLDDVEYLIMFQDDIIGILDLGE